MHLQRHAPLVFLQIIILFDKRKPEWGKLINTQRLSNVMKSHHFYNRSHDGSYVISVRELSKAIDGTVI